MQLHNVDTDVDDTGAVATLTGSRSQMTGPAAVIDQRTFVRSSASHIHWRSQYSKVGGPKLARLPEDLWTEAKLLDVGN